MSSRIAFPFLVLPDGVVSFGGWMIGDPGAPLAAAGALLENWDYARDLEVGASVTIDWAAAAAALQLPISALKLKLCLIAGTGTGNLPRRQDRLCERVVDSSIRESHLSAVVLGSNLSGRLRLSLVVTLVAPCEGGTVLSPQVQGARLWQSRQDILIEDGGDSRFPLETASFTEIFKGKPHENAPWYLHWTPGVLQADFSACVRLYVNSDRPDVLARFVEGDAPTLQAILGDVVSQMVESVIAKEDAAELLAECGEGSVGQQVQQWLDFAFPSQEVGSIKALCDQKPGTFRAAILAAMETKGSQQ
ncbi:hypothetical protein [Lysobacter niastensis]|uniref:Uncharacterized protein n=1 Tax=Lysobacter niastensis TaxID=380629 RepID=A0ABS0BCD8_9GAMM|nr:hypothetical protein [Lysobacter niastensis]MBF6025347.1 hypothetical protein [Lysobacter niastensis]